MSWQRIDENTYIDDSLVTCAEYQLFIDEMREQGKYYQPDHWSSYQFPQGQAREPILGVRISDVKTFCDWLTKRDIVKWSYRLPTFIETRQHPLISPVASPLGYWQVGANEVVIFTWVGSFHHNPRNIDLQSMRNSIMSSVLDELDLNSGFAQTFIRNVDFTFAPSDGIDLSRYLFHTVDSDIDFSLALNRFFITERIRAIDRAVELILKRFHVRAPDFTLKLYLDLYTLQERIAERSPAFEGIRLVKERIK